MVKVFDRGGMCLGTGGGILATICCSLPSLLVIFGVIGLSTVKVISAYNTYSTIASIVFIVAGTWLMIKSRNGTCDLNAMEKERYTLLGIAVSFIVMYLLLVNKALPYLTKTAKTAALGS